MIKCEILRIALTCTVLVSTIISTESANPTDPHVWKKLNLSLTTIAGATVYYEKCLEPNLPVFERHYQKLLAEKKKCSEILAQKEQIIAQINQLLGIDEPDAKKQQELFAGLIGAFSQAKPTIYLITRTTIKDFLRAGGQLPNCSYDKATDNVLYKPQFQVNSEQSPLTDFELALPASSGDEFEKDLGTIFEALQEGFGGGMVGMALHEVAEMTLLNRVKPTDPYWRWFSDGFANAVTIHILEKYAETNAAQNFAKVYDVNDCEQLKNQINLRYWMALNFCISTPLEYESKLTAARYAYATYEAKRLIDEHGIECVKKILDKIGEKERKSSEDLLTVIKEVTGADMATRLAQYQSFGSREEGLTKYAKLFESASGRKDLEQMLINLLRALELCESPYSPTSLRQRQMAASTLFYLGHLAAADEAIQQCLKMFRRTGVPEASKAASEAYIAYCLDCNKPEKALSEAEEILKEKPEHMLSLVAKMLAMDKLGKNVEAKKLAEKILALEKNEQSLTYKAARKILDG